MQRIPNPQMDRLILDHLANLYNLRTKREGIHISTLVYCLTRSFLDHSAADVDPTDAEVLLFATGLGLQEILTPAHATTPVYEQDGIVFSPDFLMPTGDSDKYGDGDEYNELKTSRMGWKKLQESLPETWVEYIKGGCHMRGVTRYNLTTLLLSERPKPVLYSETLSFTVEELADNWEYLCMRKVVYGNAVVENKPPTPFMYCKDWECGFCKHRIVCDAMATLGKDSKDE